MNLVQALELKRLLQSKLCKGCILSDGLLMRDSRGLFGHSRSTGCMMPTIWLEWLQVSLGHLLLPSIFSPNLVKILKFGSELFQLVCLWVFFPDVEADNWQFRR